MIKQDRLDSEYFEWMYNIVCNDRYYENLSYRQLLYFLHSVQFTYTIERDKNRAIDGINLRYLFGDNCGYSDEEIAKYIDIRPCSVLEMIIALAYAVEEHIMDDPTYGNRTGQWFWGMINSLGLGNMCDARFDRRYTKIVIDRFLDREYEPNGKGGLFTIQNSPQDLRDVEIWYQTLWYLNEFLSE